MWDGIIIGGGLAGLSAGLRAVQLGKKVLAVTQGAGSLPYASGTLDFGNVTALGHQDRHPYQVLGEERVRQAFIFVQEILPQYQGEWEHEQEVLTPLGQARPAGLIPRYFSAGYLHKVEEIMVVVPANLKDFFPQVYRDNLALSFPQAKIKLVPLRVTEFGSWYDVGRSVPALTYARFWRTTEGMDVLHELLSSFVKRESGVVIPGLSAEFYEPLALMLDSLVQPVVEMAHMPPAPAGQFLYEELKGKFKALGGEILGNARAAKARIINGTCRALTVESKGKELTLKGKGYILASGGFLGGGLEARLHSLREGIFDLPVFTPEESWGSPEFLGTQPYAAAGIEVDSDLRPLDPAGQVMMDNVYVCGRMLAHWDPWTENCGAGVSVASGMLAGDLI